jgi:hypothetical protein
MTVAHPRTLLESVTKQSSSVMDDATFQRTDLRKARIIEWQSLARFGVCECSEMRPVLASWKGWIRACLWRVLRAVYQVCDVIETGATGFSVKTRVMLARVTR